MISQPLTHRQERSLLALSIFGLIVPNGIFLYAVFVAPDAPDALRAALTNPVALVFIGEAFALMGLSAWLFHRAGARSPGWLAFVALSLLGSLLFSVPLFLYLQSRRASRSGAR